jgi:predicted  nucleic acid-binding Zn-ribbon protein
VGAARLEQGSCTGCHLKLPSTEVERLRKLDPDEVAFCDQCGRILVR